MVFEIYGSSQNWRWRLRATNGKIIAQGESYKRLKDCEHAVELVRSSSKAKIVTKKRKTVRKS